MNASRDMYLDKEGNVIEGLSTDTHLASGVPGTVDGMITCPFKIWETTFQRCNSAGN